MIAEAVVVSCLTRGFSCAFLHFLQCERRFRTALKSGPRLVFGEQLSRRSPARFVFEIDIRQLLFAALHHDKAGVVEFFEGPWRREAAGSHCNGLTTWQH